MSSIALAAPSPQPADGPHPAVCNSASLRLVERYELVYRLPAVPTDHPQDGAEISGQSWRYVFCTECRTEFITPAKALQHGMSSLGDGARGQPLIADRLCGIAARIHAGLGPAVTSGSASEARHSR